VAWWISVEALPGGRIVQKGGAKSCCAHNINWKVRFEGWGGDAVLLVHGALLTRQLPEGACVAAAAVHCTHQLQQRMKGRPCALAA
jgi:hypothetical protein